KKIMGKGTKHLAKIFDVKFVRIGDMVYYVIVLEKLRTSDTIVKTFNEMNEVIIKNQNNNFKRDIIQYIGKKHPVVAEFLNYMYEFGYDKTWGKYKHFTQDHPQYDFNDVSEISEWIFGSVTNDNQHTDEAPEHIIDYVKKLIQ